MLFEDKSFSETEVLLKAIRSAKEWQVALDAKVKETSASTKDCTSGVPQRQWKANTMLCYSDAAWKAASGVGGMGWVFTNQAGLTSFEGSTSKEMVGSALIAEALALKAAMEAAISKGIQDMVCFSDSKLLLISQITENKHVNELQGVLHDICVLSRSLLSISFLFVPRRSNVVADGLAKEALSSLLNSSGRL